MSEEEIIRNVKRIIEYKVISNYINNYDSRVIQGLLDLYYKQQKEIEELKTKLTIETTDNKYNQEERDEETIPKDKIREKIKEQRQKYFDIHDGEHSINEICFESTKVEGAVEILKELIEEEDGDHIPRID